MRPQGNVKKHGRNYTAAPSATARKVGARRAEQQSAAVSFGFHRSNYCAQFQHCQWVKHAEMWVNEKWPRGWAHSRDKTVSTFTVYCLFQCFVGNFFLLFFSFA